MPTPPPVTLDTRLPFRAKDALAAGISRRRLLSKGFRRIIRGVYIDAAVRPDPLHDALAVLLVTGRAAFVSHHTAARLHRAVVPHSADLHASIGHDRHRSRTSGVTVHSSTRIPVTFRGVKVTGPVDTFLDLVPHLDLVDLVVLGDSLVKRDRTTTEALVEAAASLGAGRRKALRAASLVRAKVDSPMETRLRLLVVLAGLPEPEVNIVIRDEDGAWLRRIDMGYRAPKLALEYDGRQHADSRDQYASDVRRSEDLSNWRWREWTCVSDDIFKNPADALRRLVAVMVERGMHVPHKLSDAWRAHFPGHG